MEGVREREAVIDFIHEGLWEDVMVERYSLPVLGEAESLLEALPPAGAQSIEGEGGGGSEGGAPEGEEEGDSKERVEETEGEGEATGEGEEEGLSEGLREFFEEVEWEGMGGV